MGVEVFILLIINVVVGLAVFIFGMKSNFAYSSVFAFCAIFVVGIANAYMGRGGYSIYIQSVVVAVAIPCAIALIFRTIIYVEKKMSKKKILTSV